MNFAYHLLFIRVNLFKEKRFIIYYIIMVTYPVHFVIFDIRKKISI